ncbi:Uncharacterised protein [Mycobacteroides abscessus subsp. abscessus]|nr:Uncharacterised protein [Mycobacteroides abscessus subsp. abscessus]SHV69101.1 Uncharacterised protein [Mycobacteroides abscessus subsp. abscessus]SIC75858.1 Uncharacterised protein [Mycobacteroides abscessus subsp. abscessus]
MDRVPLALGSPAKLAPTPPALAQMSRVVQPPDSTALRGATVATLSRNATTTRSVVARTNNACRLASKPPSGLVDSTTPPLAGSVATAVQGMCASKDSGAPDTSGAVMPVMFPSAPAPWGQLMSTVD